MLFELENTLKIKALFTGWEETMIFSCLQKIMGKIYVTDLENPKSAFAFVGCFGFYAGTPDIEIAKKKPEGFAIMVPQNKEWAQLIEECYPSAKRVTRYAIKKDTIFDKIKLQNEISKLPIGYEIHKLDADIYYQCLKNPVMVDFVSAFESKEKYLQIGRGMVILKDGQIMSGASSYTRYKEGIEIEVDTIETERR